jgi:UDP-N-acetyl-D-mannosaminuronate dehydrogenase
MAAWALGQLSAVLGGLAGRQILILGYSYRENVKETAFTTAKPLIGDLRAAAAQPLIMDPLYTAEELAASGATPIPPGATPPVAAVIVQAYHTAFSALDWAAFAAQGCRVVLDGRNILDSETQAAIRAAGMIYLGIGRGGAGSGPARQ